MRRLSVIVLVAATAALLGSFDRPSVLATDASRTFRVATFNIHKGADIRNHYDLDRTIDAIGRLNAHVIGMQEVMRNDPGLNCDDQPALIAKGLSTRTGRPWHHAYAKGRTAPDRRCLESRRGDDVAMEGVAIFSDERIVSSTTLRLSEQRVGLEVRLESMPQTPIVVTHLESARQKAAQRSLEIGRLLPWAASQGHGLLLGDLNALPDAPELEPLRSRYADTWDEAVASGRASTTTLEGSTRPTRRGGRIDYVMRAQGAALTLQSVDVVPTAASREQEVSDHYPVVATFLRH